jgi:hypothetical protein
MRIVINVKCRNGRVMVEPRLDQSSTDNVREINAGKALFDSLNAVFKDMAGDQKDIAGCEV